MEQERKAYAVFSVNKDGEFEIGDSNDAFPVDLFSHLLFQPARIDDNTHLAKFYRSGKERESGKLTNTMPGSDFTHYKFERHDYGEGEDMVTVIVGWYWTEEK
jgi:hypothetical protein